MTLKELSQLYYLNKEIELDKKKLLRLEADILPSGINDNLSYGAGISDKTGRIAAEIADLKAIISAKIEQTMHERSRLERYIADIDDSLTRQIFALRFVDGLSWRQIAFSIGGGNTEENVRQICCRYIKSKK